MTLIAEAITSSTSVKPPWLRADLAAGSFFTG
jgi:hypothetical protein